MAPWICLLLLLQHALADMLPIIREIKSNKVTGPFTVDTSLQGPSGLEGIAREKRSLFTAEYEQELVDQHNNLRRTVPSSDMEFMTKHSELTRMAEDWAKLCIWEHGQPPRNNPPFEHIGQNLYAYNGTFDAKRGIQLWFDEYVFYDYNTGQCSKEPCGHYTQMAWSTSRRIGCAFAYCPSMQRVDLINANYLVCNYGPSGNWVGEKPYKKGQMCTQCDNGKFWCNEGLCDRGCSKQSTTCDCKAMCHNCGTTLTNNCSCACAVGWHGPTCAEECVDTHPYCGANPGWPKSYCDKDQVRESCPVLCETCRVRTGAPVSCTTTTPRPDTRMTVPTHPPGIGNTDIVEIIPDESGSSSRYVSHNVPVQLLAIALLWIQFS